VYPYIVSLFTTASREIAPLLTVSTLFFVPSILLWAISPYAIKMKVQDLSKVGKVSGNLYALWSLWSVLGTFLTTFVFILLMPLTQIFILLAILLLFTASLCFKKGWIAWVLLVIIGSIGSLMFSLWRWENINVDIPDSPSINKKWHSYKIKNKLKESIEIETLYGNLKISDVRWNRNLYIDGGIMWSIYRSNILKTVPGWKYIDILEQTTQINSSKKILSLGIGVGLLPMKLIQDETVHVDAVDINEKIIQVAKQYFGLVTTPNLSLHVDDARMFLKHTNKKYDSIIFDISKHQEGDYTIPFHLATKEFFKLVKTHLHEKGIFSAMVVDDDFIASEVLTLSSVFKYVVVYKGPVWVVIASDSELDLQQISTEKFVNIEDIDLSKGIVITDDFAPIDPIEK